MTITTSDNKAFFTADGSTGTFYFDFRLLQAADLEVYIDEVLQDPGLYGVFINTNGVGGRIAFTVAPGSIPNPVRGLIYRYVSYTQQTKLPTESDFDQKSVENALDKLTMETQQLQEQINRAAVLSIFDESGVTVVLPPPNSRRALLWHTSEDGRLINSTYDPDELFDSTSALYIQMQSILADTQAAQAAAETAQTAAEDAAQDAEEAGQDYYTYFPTLVDEPTQSPGDMLVWQDEESGFVSFPIRNENDILAIADGVPTWSSPPPPFPTPSPAYQDSIFETVADFLVEGSNVTIFKDYDARTITINATGPSPVPPPPPPGPPVTSGSTTITFTRDIGPNWLASHPFPNPPGSGGGTNNGTEISYTGYPSPLFPGEPACFTGISLDAMSSGVTALTQVVGGSARVYNIAGAVAGSTITVTYDYQYTP